MVSLLSTYTNHTSSYTIPVTFEVGKYYIIGSTRASSTTLTFLSGFQQIGNILVGNNSTSYSAYGTTIWFGKATNTAVTVQVIENNTIIMVGRIDVVES